MPVVIQCANDLPVSIEEAALLWQHALTACDATDEHVSVRCVSAAESEQLNTTYRKKIAPTNVLTFSYGDEHDVALCMEVARSEAKAREVALRDYTALLLVHAYLHALGLDHEESEAVAERTAQLERVVLEQAGFVPTVL